MPSPTQIGVAQRQRMYAVLCEFAARGAPMPTNDDIRAQADAGSDMSKKLADLARAGLISIELKPNGRGTIRRCVFLATGDRTAWSKLPPASGLPNRPIGRRYPLLASRGKSDFAIYGHLADAVRTCRRAGDVVHRNERRPVEILINGRPGDVKARAAWHAAQSSSRYARVQIQPPSNSPMP
jgi:hypothetical protein